MEMGSISLTESGSSSPPNSSNDSSLNGLKFGRKIYFEDPTKPAAGSTSATSGSGPRKGRGGGSLIQGGQPPRCQVEGCKVDLSDAKAYYSRHKVCGMHSKSPQVVVGGIQQRFCQQCSRFHQLSEFDQGKRSCRRRLAGHNERRRKPPPGSLLSSRYGRLSSSIFENGNRSGGFLVDFTAYPRHVARDSWPPVRSHERGAGSQATGEAKFLVHHHHPWQGNSDNPPPGDVLLQQGSGNAFPSTGGIPSPGECYTAGVVTADSSCALSLLSNQPQPWGSRSNNSMVSQHEQTAPHGTSVNHHFPGVSLWAFKADEAGDGPNSGVLPDLGLSQFSQPLNSHFSGEVELPQQGRRQYMELDHSRAFDSSHQVHWSL